MSREDSGSSSVVSFLLGAVAGAAAGLLLAPRSGKETREKLEDWLDERRERGNELLHKIKDGGAERKDQIVAAVRAGKQAYAEAAKHNHHESE